MKKNLILSFLKKICNAIFPIPLFAVPALAQTKDKPEDWLNYNRTYEGDRYSPLKQITQANVGKLHLLHTFDLGNDVSSLQTGPGSEKLLHL
jgi:glucose dehydrogenase